VVAVAAQRCLQHANSKKTVFVMTDLMKQFATPVTPMEPVPATSVTKSVQPVDALKNTSFLLVFHFFRASYAVTVGIALKTTPQSVYVTEGNARSRIARRVIVMEVYVTKPGVITQFAQPEIAMGIVNSWIAVAMHACKENVRMTLLKMEHAALEARVQMESVSQVRRAL